MRDCPVGGEGGTEAGLEEAPGAGQGRTGKVAVQVEGLFSQTALWGGVALMQYCLMSPTAPIPSNGYLLRTYYV